MGWWTKHSEEKPTHIPASERPYRPLDASSWNDAARVIIGWFGVIVFAVLSGGLFAIYEMLIINVGDTDLRAMQYDYRITNVPTSYYHWHFVNANSCCNADSVVPNGPCYTNSQVELARGLEFRDIPECPPLVTFQCYDLTERFCNQTRSVVYNALGLAPNGQYASCTIGGLLRVGSQQIATTRETSLVVTAGDNSTLTTHPFNIFAIGEPAVQAGINAFIAATMAQYGTYDAPSPYTALGSGVTIDGAPAALELLWVQPQKNTNSVGKWPREIFPWPGMGGACTQTFTTTQFYLQGLATGYALSPFDYSRPQDMVSTLRFFNSSATFGQWKVEFYETSNVVQLPKMDWVNVYAIAALEARVSMVASLGSCYNWALETGSLKATYSSKPVYSGLASNLSANAIAGRPVELNITVRDASAPVYPALPPYTGMWYIVFCFLCAAFWLWGLGIWIVFGIPLIWWNVRSNAGKAPLVYRYMRRYRGW